MDKVQVTECHNFGLATLMMRKSTDALQLGEALQAAMPAGPTCTKSTSLTVIGTGPGTWLAFEESAQPAWAEELAARLPGVSVSDQSGGYVIYKLTGAGSRTLLQKGAFIDLAPSIFGAGSVATTVIAHIGVVIWQIDDAETFHVALFRSFADSFRNWLTSASH